MWKLPLAIVITILIVIPKANASPSQLNNQEQATGNAGAMTPIVANESQTVTAPSPEPQIVPVTEKQSPPVTVATPVIYHTDNYYMEYIFQHESSGRLTAVNYLGCIGLGQDCNGQLAVKCPNWTTDQACQVAFFSDYAVRRYGSWEASCNFWINNHWW